VLAKIFVDSPAGRCILAAILFFRASYLSE
jgi:hypothetical protein